MAGMTGACPGLQLYCKLESHEGEWLAWCRVEGHVPSWNDQGNTQNSSRASGGAVVTARRRTETQPRKITFLLPKRAPPLRCPDSCRSSRLVAYRAVSEAEHVSTLWLLRERTGIY